MKIKMLSQVSALGLALLLAVPSLPAAQNGMELARQLNEAFISVADKASQSVVVIEVAGKPSKLTSNGLFDNLPPALREQFEEFFKDRGQDSERRPSPRSRQRQSERLVPQGEGSGVIISEDGFILTNNHVVENAEKITVRTRAGKEYTAKVQGTDPQSDIAVIKIEAKGLPAAKLGDSSKTRVGEFAIAIGAPFALNYSVTVGHISAKGRAGLLPNSQMIDQEFIQTDASINPGNSGGPLVNLDGEVIGINSLIRGMNTGIGFAVPINLAKEVSDKLVADGKYTRSWLGVNIATLSETKQYRDSIKGVTDGVVIANILPTGPAAKSELEPGDVVTAVDGKPVKTAPDFKNEIRSKKVGANAMLDVVRDGKKIKVKVTPGAMPDDQFAVNRGTAKESAPSAEQELGLTVETLTAKKAKELGLKAATGVLVTEVESGSLAEERGIQPGNVIARVDRKSVTNIADFRDALKTADVKKGVSLTIQSESGRRLEILKDDGK
ncbi:MAG: trypsin-like peptidase domain-containing protein [Verrucomicrobia bacterium]|nr:trypsin-like peptidase domain-containing protein [Verrucomicrobiota bacterium]